ncbi:MAG: AsmA family protein [Alphaproteobacteria bacterium]|nr:AsmA family protein [Alphaproteobacteria bacterium]
MRFVKWLAIGIVGLVVVAVAAVFVIASSIDPNQYKPQIVEAAKKATGRDLVLKGDIKLSIGLSPSFGIADVSFGNAAWGSRPEMVKVGRFEVQVALLPLLSKQVEVKRLVLLDTDILLETDAKGKGNWEFDAPAKPGAIAAAPAQGQPAAQGAGGGTPLPVVREVELRNARFAFRDGVSKQTNEVKLERVLLNADSASSPLRLDIAGSANVPELSGEQKFALKGSVGSVERMLQTSGQPWPVDLTMTLGENALSAHVSGGIVSPTQGKGYSIDLAADVPEVQKLAALAKQEIPALGPLKLAVKAADSGPGARPTLPDIKIDFGRADTIRLEVAGSFQDPVQQRGIKLAVKATSQDIAAPFKAAKMDAPVTGPLDLQFNVSDPAAARYQISGLKLAVGPSGAVDLSGDVNVALPPGGKPSVQANLRSQTVDLVRLMPAKSGSSASAPAKPAAGAAAGGGSAANDGRVIPNEKVPFDLLNAANAELKYAAAAIVTQGATLKGLNLQLVVNNGVLTLRPLTFEMDGGKFVLDATANAAQKNFTNKIEMRQLEVGRVLTERKLNDWFSGGPTTLDVNLRGAGDTARQLAASLAGDVYLNMGKGELGKEATKVIGEWLGTVFPPLAKVTIGTSVRCAIHKIDFRDGIGVYKAGLIDTGVMSARTTGTINLATEQLALNQIAGPVAFNIGGTLAKPSYTPDAAGTAQALLQGGAGTVTGIAKGGVGTIAGLLGGRQQAASGPASDECAQALAAATGKAAPPTQAAPASSQQKPAQAAPSNPGGITLPGGIKLPFGR